MDPVILYTLASIGGIGFIMGATLGFASKKFHVEVDPRVEQVKDILPGANCGGCGYAGCTAYAEAVVINGEKETLCAPGGPNVCQAIARILGREQSKHVRSVAYLHCAGSADKAKDKFKWDGIQDCRVAAMVAGGSKACSFGCLGLGTCAVECPFDAIHMNENGLPEVDREKCTACGMCVRVCPKNLYELLPDTTTIYLACSSHDRGKAVKDACSVGCIGCGICVKVTEGDTVEMQDSLPSVDYSQSPSLILAHYKCPTNSYIDLAKKRPRMFIDTKKCTGNHKCAEVCPVKDCVTGEPGKVHKINPEKCIGCGLCVDACPDKAIRIVGAMGYVNNLDE